MRIITRTPPADEPRDWRQILADSFRDINSLLRYLEIDTHPAARALLASDSFPLLVPRPFAQRMQRGNPDDPLLLQVLPQASELETAPGFVADPLAEKHSNIRSGIIHKYQGRVLLLAATGCAVNCRYCFRRHFDYQNNRIGRKEWQEALDYVRSDISISEVILSGGDPLMLSDEALNELLMLIEDIPHISRLRIHTRLPVVIPQRLTDTFIRNLNNSRLGTSVVLHINHPQELHDLHAAPLQALRSGGTWLLNQSVLLNGVNNEAGILRQLSEALFSYGISPYYLHMPDRVAGTHQFDVSEQDALRLYRDLRSVLPGYLVPQLVRERAGVPFKSVMADC
ncbi:MAG TPA: EF-P beta-lysylation protein EpmB [Oceanospirillales bacterium]|nr:EF-P beta-lysylation protein EpmB [Oceanospirillaceae bacterium]MAR02109.1 EF-P beta-lysylation protein EpmB [Oceanospirillaceae bacterium]HBS41548.1 EF-P beta-lysylation protein EpmB [Oceanospirillales bacterium]